MAEWSIPFDVLAEKAKKDIATVVRLSTLEMFSRVVLRSPVDTGRFRANWNVSYNVPDDSTSSNLDTSGRGKLAEVKSAVLSMPVGGVIYMCNSLPYAIPLEYGLYPNPPIRGSKKRGEESVQVHVTGGFSNQAPAGMVRVTAREFAYAVLRSLNLSKEA